MTKCKSCGKEITLPCSWEPGDEKDQFGWKCESCGKIFDTLHGFEIHRGMKFDECGTAGFKRVWVCPYCGEDSGHDPIKYTTIM